MGNDLFDRIAQARAALSALNPTDQDALAKTGLLLEETLHSLPEGHAVLRGLLLECLEALQVLFQRGAPNPPALADAVASAMAAAEQCLSAEDKSGAEKTVEKAVQALRHALRKDPAPEAPANAMDPADRRSLVKEFLVESYENLDRLDQDLLALEKNPGDRERLSSVFRTIHTIKGTCGFLGFSKLERLSHVGESLLSRLRDGHLAFTPKIASPLLRLVDAVRAMLASIEKAGQEGDGDYADLIEALARDSGAAASSNKEGTGLWTGEDHRSDASDSTIRVDVDLLDRLMNLVGELVLARNQIMKHAAAEKGAALAAPTQRLNALTSELQEGVMKTRMQPIGNIWRRFPRVVRDLTVACGKQARVQMDGEGTELDKSIIEAIKDPLTHIVRNAVDHGIEPVAERLAKGKPAEGVIALRAFHEAGYVIIEMTDDGAGLPLEKIKQKALRQGLITADQAAHLGEREAFQLVFAPGFSTADKVTNVSGRGVGMDVVKTNIEKIGGIVDLQSQAGLGTTIKIRIPLTLAIIPALIVICRENRFAIPQVNLIELVQLEGGPSDQGIEDFHGAPVYRLRGQLLPLVYLDQVLGGPAASMGTAAASAVNIIVLKTDERQFGLVVEGIGDTEEIVVKPLGKLLKGLACFAGATIMGDGKVALILDVTGLAHQARMISETRDKRLSKEDVAQEVEKIGHQSILLFQRRNQDRMAIPLSSVARLEHFPVSAIEKSNHQEVIAYRDQIMPLIWLSRVLDGAAPTDLQEGRSLQVVVHSANGRFYGLVVDRILDIVEESLRVKRVLGVNGIAGSAMIQGKVTDLLDVAGVVRGADAAGAAPAREAA